MNQKQLIEIETKLLAGLSKLGIPASLSQIQKCLHYLQLLHKWNQVQNLTAVKDPLTMASRHLLDSLAILPHIPSSLNKGVYLDVGSGAGLPGIPLAIFLEECEMHLCEAREKRVLFLRQVVQELQLTRCKMIHERCEKIKPTKPYDIIMSRAFASIKDFLLMTQHLSNEQTLWFAMKGEVYRDELNEIPSSFKLKEIISLQVPFETATRHLIIFTT